MTHEVEKASAAVVEHEKAVVSLAITVGQFLNNLAGEIAIACRARNVAILQAMYGPENKGHAAAHLIYVQAVKVADGLPRHTFVGSRPDLTIFEARECNSTLATLKTAAETETF